MYLKSLTLKGFKSFAQSTTFAFEQGVTCVVGPNGSGKSNVVDALAWVMGEQGAKTLRGGKMEDVIFAGTSTRGPLGRAQVLLTIDNSDGALPIDYTEVTISRTLFRNGGSEYAINGDSCRLLDVQELLSDSGLGREMHVIVGQGQLDQVLHASAEERRGFIEEAAGILKHRRRKEKTVRKLDAMQANLTRLSDLAGEIRRQLKPLGHQAEIAREAQSIQAVVRDARARLLADDVVALRRALDDHTRGEQERHSERIVVQEQLEQAQLRASRLEQAQIGDAVDTSRRTAFALESVQERLRSLYTLANQRLALLGSEAETPDAQPTVSAATIDEARAELLRLTAAVDDADDAWKRAAAETAAARASLDGIDQEIAAQSALVSRHDLEISKLSGQADTAASRLAAVRGEHLRQQNALEAAEQRRLDASARLADLEGEEAPTNHGQSGLDEEYELAQARVFDTDAEIERLRDELHRAERERDALQAKKSALSRALDVKNGSADLTAAGLAGILGVVADHVQVTPGSEAAIAAALGTLAEAVLADTDENAARAVAYARDNKLGRVDVVIAGDASLQFSPPPDANLDDANATERGRASDADVAGSDMKASARHDGAGSMDFPARAGSLVRADTLVQAPEGVLALLSTIYVAPDVDSARRERVTLTHPDRVTVVTDTGDVLTSHVLSGGSGEQPSRIELLAERDAAADALEGLTSTIERLRYELTEQRQQNQVAKKQSADALQMLRQYDAELAAHSEKVNRALVQVESSTAECERIRSALALAENTVNDAQTALDQAKQALEQASSRPRPILDVSARDAVMAELDAAREAEVQARLSLETARERVRQGDARIGSLVRRRDQERRQAEEAARRAVIRRRQVDAATHVIETLPAVLASVDRSVAESSLRLAAAEEERRSQNEELGALRRQEAGLRERLQAITENVHGLELQIYEKKLHLSGLLERAGSELGLVEDVLVAEYGPDQLVPDDADLLATIAEKVEAQEAAAAAAVIAELEAEIESGSGGGAPATRRVSADTVVSSASDTALEPESASRMAVGEGDDGASDAPIAAPRGIPFDRAAQKKRFERAERKLAQLGRVNPLALEEFAALEQRHAFLTEQLADLTKTRKDLLTIIDELDDRMQTIFRSAFDDTQRAFTDVFPVLFPGGTGSISLTNPDDLLTTGIEVQVKPAGKKIERLSLLSGGERSLAAVALLISIFKARPSPFYIMDEVEAALDDANLGRLLEIFEDLRSTSQLIVITHQKRTMEIADALYGVSMRQDGVSAVVGQRVATP
ncbi:AAA family ATPase [Okibacterium fritillariae]|uniref:Chromosome partition protein Smc n=1 Tax=Okibacterium fritillariae TaxID=123320 RepID=A0A1T5J6X6_9MICO|nr:AAA family ATPase [Okibacterium fritillariae]SKC46983.1 condensin subunit Smc [Okibacterium fritillariae]